MGKYEQASNVMHTIIRLCRPVFAQELFGPNLYSLDPIAFEVSKKHSLLISAGTNGLLFRLEDEGKSEEPLIAKTSFYTQLKNGNYALRARPAGMPEPGMGRLEDTVSFLDKMGYEVPKMIEYGHYIRGKYACRTIMPDLRENEKFKVKEAAGFNYNSIQDGKELKKEYERAWKHVLEQCTSGKYEIFVNGHISDEGPDEVIKHIFLIQYAPGGKGKLIPMDLDHLLIWQKKPKRKPSKKK